MRHLIRTVLGAACIATGATADELAAGNRTIYLQESSGERHTIGQLQLTNADDGSAAYKLVLNDAAFGDYFLSMRPFQCLEGVEKHWCYVPYPYENNRKIKEGDLTDLEYDLLFIWKGATEYGINMWNGVYYDLTVQDGRISGELLELDMDVLSAPPAPGELRPLRPADLHSADPDSHWLPYVVIE